MIKGVTHDSNEHIEHRQTSEKCRDKEKEQGHCSELVLGGILNDISPVAKRNQVLVEQAIGKPPACVEDVEELSVFALNLTDHTHGHTDHEKRDQIDQQERQYLRNRHLNQVYVKRCRVKESKSVKHLHDQQEAI